jgi:hypothetical protein
VPRVMRGSGASALPLPSDGWCIAYVAALTNELHLAYPTVAPVQTVGSLVQLLREALPSKREAHGAGGAHADAGAMGGERAEDHNTAQGQRGRGRQREDALDAEDSFSDREIGLLVRAALVAARSRMQ